MDAASLKARLANSAFTFRGYNVTNLGRSHELLAHPTYRTFVYENLKEGSRVCSDVISKRIDLLARVRRRRESTLRTYPEAIALIMAMEKAQLDILRECFDIEFETARLSFGFSLGEITAVALSGVLDLSDAMRVPLSLAQDCAALASDVTLGVLFSRGRSLPFSDVQKLCLEINQEQRGIIGISTLLSPNSLLLMGQGDTVDRFKNRMSHVLPGHTNLRKTHRRFPPLHTSITWQRHIPSRAAMLMQSLPGGLQAPRPPVFSLVTGGFSYNDYNARDILHDWVDHPQRLWDAVYETLRAGIETVVHVGPAPNIIPATYKRLRDNVEAETRGKIGMRALKAVVHHPWLKTLLPERTALLRAPNLQHVILEDWLLAQEVRQP